MKLLSVAFFVLLATTQVFSQKRSKEDPRDAQIDSLTRYTVTLNAKVDSLSLELVKYVGVYDAIKAKVLHYNFDPTRASYLIDSLKASRDSATAKLYVKPLETVQKDSVVIVKEMKTFEVSPADLARANAIGHLKQLKELLDAKIITEAEFVTLKAKYLNKL